MVELDTRLVGGHGSDYCGKAVVLDILKCFYNGVDSNIHDYLVKRKYLPENERNIKFRMKKFLRPYWYVFKNFILIIRKN